MVPAAGKGARMESDLPKQYLELLGCTILEHTLRRLLRHPAISGAVVAIAPDDDWFHRLRHRLPPVRLAFGGAERCHSVLNALKALAADTAADDLANDWVLVHDAARPCLHADDVSRLFDTLAGDTCGGILAVPVRDTLKRAGTDGCSAATVDRTGLWHALTPQMFRYGVLRRALEDAIAQGVLVTDEAQAVERAGGRVRLVAGRPDNLKITRPEDLAFAEFTLRTQAEQVS